MINKKVMKKVNYKTMKKLGMFLIIGAGVFLVSCVSAAEYYVDTSTSTVDGDTFCGGSPCTSSDVIYIEGPRGDLQLRDFDGNGSYITITNKANHQAILTSSKIYTIALTNCAYVDLRGDNDPANTYGIVCNNLNPSIGHNVWVWHNPDTSDHIKISYLEIDSAGTGISVIYGANPNTLIYDTFEIHHNYIHDVGYGWDVFGAESTLD